MLVCHFSSVHRMNDTRVYYRQVRGLLGCGISVHLIGREADVCKNKNLTTEVFPEYKSRVRRVIFGNLLMLSKLWCVKADVYQFHDPELVFVGVLLRLMRRKVIFDVHENFEQQIKAKPYFNTRFSRFIALLLAGVEKFTARFMTGIICAVPAIQSRFGHRRSILFRNFPDFSLINTSSSPKPEPESGKGFNLFYPGALSEGRGIKYLIDVLDQFDDEVYLTLMGNFSDENFERTCRQSSGWSKVKYLGRRSVEEVYSEMSKVDVGFQYVKDTPQYRIGYPVKVFEFLAAGVPVIVSDIGNRRSLFGENVIYCEPESLDALKRTIDYVLANNKMLKQELISKRESLRQEYDYRFEVRNYIAFLEGLVA